MSRKHKSDQPNSSSVEPIADRTLVGPANAAETAVYVAQMCVELRMLAKSSADYIASMTCELATLASSAKLERLSSLLESVRQEAETAA
jgi:hypothetical protein